MKKVAKVEAVVEVVSAERLHLRDIKREASRRCRARAKSIASGKLLTPELAIRSLQSKALNLENFKMVVGNKTFRLNKNGGSAVMLVISETTESGIVKTRKSHKTLKLAIKAFNEAIKA